MMTLQPILLDGDPSQLPDIEPRDEEQARETEAKTHKRGTLIAWEGCALDLDSGKAICPAGTDRARIAPTYDVLIRRDAEGLSFLLVNEATLAKRRSENCSPTPQTRDRFPID